VELLTAVNSILPFLEENTVTNINTKHPTVALVLGKLDNAREFLLTKRYWFNNEKKQFYLAPDGRANVGTNLLAMYTTDKRLNYEARGQFVYDLNNSTYILPSAFEAQITVDLTFEELPHFAALWVQWRAAVEAYTQDFQVDQVVQILSTREIEAMAMLEREHLRKRNFSSMRSPPGHRFINSLRA